MTGKILEFVLSSLRAGLSSHVIRLIDYIPAAVLIFAVVSLAPWLKLFQLFRGWDVVPCPSLHSQLPWTCDLKSRDFPSPPVLYSYCFSLDPVRPDWRGVKLVVLVTRRGGTPVMTPELAQNVEGNVAGCQEFCLLYFWKSSDWVRSVYSLLLTSLWQF